MSVSMSICFTESRLRQIIHEALLSEVEYSHGNIEYIVTVKKDQLYMTPKVLVSAVIGSIAVGKVLFSVLNVGYKKTIADEAPACYSDIQSLEARGMVASMYWYPGGADVLEDFQNKGIGKGIYRAAFEKIRGLPGGPHIVIPANCTGWIATSRSALRVWDSIASEYPHSGRVIYLR